MAEKSLQEEMVATYAVSITGVQRTKAEMRRLDDAIKSLREAEYSPGVSGLQARFGTSKGDRLLRTNENGKEDFFVAQITQLDGRVQSGATKAMASGMAKGRETQAGALRAATTKTGDSGYPSSRKSAGREVTGTMIKAIRTNVDTQKTSAVTLIAGWHGWRRHREEYMKYQEMGTKGRKSGQQIAALNRLVKKRRLEAAAGRGVPAANSLGASIIIVREHLKRELEKLA